MCNHEKAANAVLSILEEDFQFSAKERGEALLLALQVLGDEELFEEPEKVCEVS
ncbi:MAG: hypothetical protein V7731_08425 [Amphritea sp.]